MRICSSKFTPVDVMYALRISSDSAARSAGRRLVILVALWQLGWSEIEQSHHQRQILAFQAKKWSDRVLAASGLLG